MTMTTIFIKFHGSPRKVSLDAETMNRRSMPRTQYTTKAAPRSVNTTRYGCEDAAPLFHSAISSSSAVWCLLLFLVPLPFLLAAPLCFPVEVDVSSSDVSSSDDSCLEPQVFAATFASTPAESSEDS